MTIKRMLYEECSMCQGTGMVVFTKPGACIEGKQGCIGCKSMRVVETGLTAGQAEMLVKFHSRSLIFVLARRRSPCRSHVRITGEAQQLGDLNRTPGRLS